MGDGRGLARLGALIVALIASLAFAQAPATRSTEPLKVAQSRPVHLPTDYDTAFRAMIADPADLDLTFRFAELAIAAGDFEGAVSAFERPCPTRTST